MSFLRSISWVGGGTAISIVISVLSVPAIINGYIVTEVAYFLWLWTLLGVMNLADFGLSRGVSKFISAKNNIAKALLYGYIYALVVSIVLGMGGWILIESIHFEFWNELPYKVKAISIALFILSFLTFPLAGAMEGLGKFRDISIIKNLGNIVAYCVPIIFSIYKINIFITLALSIILSRLIIFFSIYFFIYKAIKKYRFEVNKCTEERISKSYNIGFFFSFCSSVGIVSIIGVVFLYWDRTLVLSSLVHNDAVSYVAFSEMLIKVYAIPGILSGVIFQFISSKAEFNKKLLLVLMPRNILSISFIIAMSSAVSFFFIKDEILAYIFKNNLNDELESLFLMVVFFSILNCFNMLAMTMAQALNNHKKILYLQLVALPFFLLVSYVLAYSNSIQLAILIWFTRIPIIYIYTVFLNYKSITLRGL